MKFSNIILFTALAGLNFCLKSEAAVILQYHHIDTQTPAITSTSPELFEQHLRYIDSTDLEVVPLSDVVSRPSPSHDNRVAITFDDAYTNILDNAVPLLVKFEWPFTIFVATEYVGQKGYLSWQQLRQIETLGGTIANHTHSHLHMLRQLDAETREKWLARLSSEITASQNLLEKHLNAPAKHFAYPYGEYNADIMSLVETLGFAGFGQQSGAAGPHTNHALFPRFPLSGVYANVDTFKNKLHSQPLPAFVKYHAPMPDVDPPSLQLNFTHNDSTSPPELRLSELRCYGPGGLTQLEFESQVSVVATNNTPLPVGRSRYNCTMPLESGQSFYWFSQLWIKKRADGSWYPEP